MGLGGGRCGIELLGEGGPKKSEGGSGIWTGREGRTVGEGTRRFLEMV
jgi:hypothetical protein